MFCRGSSIPCLLSRGHKSRSTKHGSGYFTRVASQVQHLGMVTRSRKTPTLMMQAQMNLTRQRARDRGGRMEGSVQKSPVARQGDLPSAQHLQYTLTRNNSESCRAK